MEENQGTGLKSFETEPQKNSSTPRGKSPRNRLLDRVKQLDSLSRNKELKLAKLADVQLEIASLERLLYNDSREDRNNELAAQHEQDTAEIARLTQANAEFQTRATQRVIERIPDDRVQGLQEQVSTLESLLKDVSALSRSVDIDERTRHAVSLIVEHGKRAMSVVEEMGVSFSSVVTALQKSETELLGLLQQAQQEGPALPVYRAVLGVRDSVQVDRHGKKHYPDVFDDGYAKEL
jgi:hypothetical protein